MYNQLTNFENLYSSYKLTCKGKRKAKTTINYSINLAKNLWDIQQRLEQKTFHFGSYHKFYVYEPKQREIDALCFQDRIVQHCLCDYILEPYFERRLIYDNASCRKGKGVHFAMERLSKFMREYFKIYGTDGYILKYDIRKYFQNNDHDVLKTKLINFPDEEVKDFLFQIIDQYEYTHKKGIPMGNQTINGLPSII